MRVIDNVLNFTDTLSAIAPPEPHDQFEVVLRMPDGTDQIARGNVGQVTVSHEQDKNGNVRMIFTGLGTVRSIKAPGRMIFSPKHPNGIYIREE